MHCSPAGGPLHLQSTIVSRNASVQFGLLALFTGGISKVDPKVCGLPIVDLDSSGLSRGIDPQILAHELSGPVSALNVLTNMLADSSCDP